MRDYVTGTGKGRLREKPRGEGEWPGGKGRRERPGLRGDGTKSGKAPERGRERERGGTERGGAGFGKGARAVR